MLDSVTNYFTTLSAGWLYLALFLSAYIENIFPPIPGDTVTVFAAYIAGRARERFLGVFLATTLGNVAGFMTYYWIGRQVDPDFFVRKNFRFLPASRFESAGRWFRHYGHWVILLNRFLSGVRSVISIVTGLYRVPWLQVLVLCTIGCSLWNLMLIWAGYLLGANWRRIESLLAEYSRILLVAGFLLILVLLLRKRFLAVRDRD
jgi:membrane protein DedA with SNARE-associated domain